MQKDKQIIETIGNETDKQCEEINECVDSTEIQENVDSANENDTDKQIEETNNCVETIDLQNSACSTFENEIIENEEVEQLSAEEVSVDLSNEDNEPNVEKVVKKPNLWTRFVKRTFDIFASLFAIILLIPFFLIFTPIVAIAMKGNPFFVQERPGRNEKIFKLIKYRTMTNKKDKDGNLLPDADRLTKFGKIMRSLSIDELPELFNIFVGQMSIVGPRPLLVKYLPLYNDFQKQRHIVRPGLTGLAQVSGRNAISWGEKFEKDIEYIDTMSFWKDIKIIFLTIKKVFVRDGISQEGEATMESFEGNN